MVTNAPPRFKTPICLFRDAVGLVLIIGWRRCTAYGMLHVVKVHQNWLCQTQPSVSHFPIIPYPRADCSVSFQMRICKLTGSYFCFGRNRLLYQDTQNCLRGCGLHALEIFLGCTIWSTTCPLLSCDASAEAVNVAFERHALFSVRTN